MTALPKDARSVPAVRHLDDCALSGQRVLIRVDMNVPVESGIVSSDERIRAHLPTIEYALEHDAGVILLSHLGRPNEGEICEELSLKPVSVRLAELLGRPVRFERDYLNHLTVSPQEVVLCENVRFNKGETSDDESLAKKLSALGDIFVMDAFGTAHRAHASTHSITKFMPQACAGFLLLKELEGLRRALQNPQRPVLAILGGAKISTKLGVIESLAKQADCIIPGGGIANTLLMAQGYEIGKSLCQRDMLEQAKHLIDLMQENECGLELPIDAVCATQAADDAEVSICNMESVASDKVPADQMILDVGPRSRERFARLVNDAGTIIWNGPLGMFEKKPFAEGTRRLAIAIGRSKAYSLAGGGDTLSAIAMAIADAAADSGADEKHAISYVSTGGGALLEFIEGKDLPGIAALGYGRLN